MNVKNNISKYNKLNVSNAYTNVKIIQFITVVNYNA